VAVHRQALVAHPAERIFAIIEAAEDYPAFLPWCAGATILQREPELVSARIHIAWRGVRFSFVTRNPKRPPEWMTIGLEEGPFRRFEGRWTLTPLAEWGCRVEFGLVYEMNSALLGALAGRVFEHAVNTLVDAFVERADQVAAGRARISTLAAAAAPGAPLPKWPAEPPLALPVEPPVAAPAASAPDRQGAGPEGGIIDPLQEDPR
jgi:ribosome-associated toxin RatA of RatAB toxin-antitoxin module